MTRPCASRTLLSSCLRGQCRLTLWGTLDAGPSRRGPAQAFSSIAAMYPVLASATAPAISGALSTRPQRRRVAGRIQRSELLPSRDAPAGLSNRARRTPRSWRGLPPRRSPTLGVGAFRRRGTAGFPESGLCSHRCGPWGLWIRFSHA